MSALLTTNLKPKETKEKEKEKEKEKDTKETKESKDFKDKDFEKLPKVHNIEQDELGSAVQGPALVLAPESLTDGPGVPVGRAFILAEERPPVGQRVVQASSQLAADGSSTVEAQSSARSKKKSSVEKPADSSRKRSKKVKRVREPQLKESPLLKAEADRLKSIESPGADAPGTNPGKPRE